MTLESGHCYRFPGVLVEGEVFRYNGAILVNLTMPGGDLMIEGDRILTMEGTYVDQLDALTPDTQDDIAAGYPIHRGY